MKGPSHESLTSKGEASPVCPPIEGAGGQPCTLERFEAMTAAGQDAGPGMPEHLAREVEESAVSRRDFMQLSGLGAAGLLFAGCGAKPREAVPCAERTEGVTPGVSYWYAGTCAACSAGCGVLFKVRDGRPIKVEGSPDHPLSRGGLCARGQASVLSLYDPDRLRRPQIRGAGASWSDVDKLVADALRAGKGQVRLLTGTVNGPATRDVIQRFLARHPGSRHVAYDAISCGAIREAHRRTHGDAVVPAYRFDRAHLIVSFSADFLGSWISPVEYSAQWAEARRLDKGSAMSRHVQLEAAMTLTGSNADQRYRLPESERGRALVALANRVATCAGKPAPFDEPASCSLSSADLNGLAGELWEAKGAALVVSGASDVGQQIVVNAINSLIGAYGATLDLASPSLQKLGDDHGVADLVNEMSQGKVGVLILWNVNPVYDLPQGAAFGDALKQVAMSVAMCDRANETASLCTAIAPPHHALEAWNDYEPQRGFYGVSQPAIRALHDTRAPQTSLLTWAGLDDAGDDYRRMLYAYWSKHVLDGASWPAAVERGYVDRRATAAAPAFREDALSRDCGKGAANVAIHGEGLEAVTVESVAMGDGRHANNAWLQELPDPLSKLTWGNAALLAPAEMKRRGLADGALVRIEGAVDGRDIRVELPAVAQPGMAEGSVALALGYGRVKAGRLARSDYHGKDAPIGANAFPLIPARGVARVGLTPLGTVAKLARTQQHDSQEGRPIARETTLAAWRADSKAGTGERERLISMWPERQHPGHHWGLVVNLNACTGCSGCIVGCQAENNIPVVGRDEVARQREMHWLRIDRYYSDDNPGDLGAVAENSRVVYQPMMCQHCNNAPCETVCPVAATTHSEEGLNQQTYNRCVGTRYCANNCPYKVRRFNWFDYKRDDPTLNLVLNPDVTVRSRGIMEKCSLCVQRIWEAKLKASKEGRRADERDLTTACQQSCPTQAIVFGDLNDKTSRVARLEADPRSYAVLDELNVRPNVSYLTKVRNTGGMTLG